MGPLWPNYRSIGTNQVRWATFGAVDDLNAQPHEVRCHQHLYGAHNGNVTNFHELKRTYFGERKITLGSDCDLEVVLYVFADELMKRGADKVGLDDIEACEGSQGRWLQQDL